MAPLDVPASTLNVTGADGAADDGIATGVFAAVAPAVTLTFATIVDAGELAVVLLLESPPHPARAAPNITAPTTPETT
jgi:hypothetical protein